MEGKLVVIGAGSWGTALASLAAPHVDTVIWARSRTVADEISVEHTNSRYLPDVALSRTLVATAEIEHALLGAAVVLIAVPSHGTRAVLEMAAPHIAAGTPVFSLSKGIEDGSMRRMSEVIEEVIPHAVTGVLTGPNLAREIALGQPAACQRVWRAVVGDEDQKSLLADAADEGVERMLHKTIKKVGEDIEAMKFNTAIAAMMEFVNAVFKAGKFTASQAERFTMVLAPFAPHLAEELWQQLGHTESLAYEPWPAFDPKLVVEDTVEIPVQVNGKLRSVVSVPAGASQEAILEAALADEKVQAAVAGKTVVKKIVVPGKLVNLVVK